MDNMTPVQFAWNEFANSTHVLFEVQPDDRPLDQFIDFRNSVLDGVEADKFLVDLDNEWRSTLANQPDIENALLLELQAFPKAIEVAKATKDTEESPKGFRNRWLSRAATVAGSVKDICKENTYARLALTLFEELCRLFKRSE